MIHCLKSNIQLQEAQWTILTTQKQTKISSLPPSSPDVACLLHPITRSLVDYPNYSERKKNPNTFQPSHLLLMD